VDADAPETDLAPYPLARPMLYTSGTTGPPKGVWTGVLPEAHAAALVAEEAALWGFAADDVLLVVSPLHHSAPLRFAAGTLLAGGDVVLTGGVAAMPRAIAEHRPTSAFVAPAHLHRLFAAGDAGLPPLTACSPDEWRERPGTVGRARSGRRLEVAADGVIWCHVPDHARFVYWRDPVKTATAWHGDAFSVFDLGRLDRDGYLYLEGRRSDLIITGGVNVYPLEVEQALLAHPGVHEAAVFGVDDERWGQRVVAAVVTDIPVAELEAFLGARLAPYERPKKFIRVDALPHTATGKLNRASLAEVLGLGR
jgi:long-chain acyl-CoA synthetase